MEPPKKSSVVQLTEPPKKTNGFVNETKNQTILQNKASWRFVNKSHHKNDLKGISTRRSYAPALT